MINPALPESSLLPCSPRYGGLLCADARVLAVDGDRTLVRGRLHDRPEAFVLLAGAAGGDAMPDSNARLASEFALRAHLDPAWAAVPTALEQRDDVTYLLLDDPGGESLATYLGAPVTLRHFLEHAVAIAEAIGRMHDAGIVHKDVKPSNILLDPKRGRAWLTGFGIASRMPRERQSFVPAEVIAGSLAYMAPEQTGRMNRSIDSRSDLYSLGVSLYELLLGELPFMAAEPMEWIHCHVAREPLAPSARRNDIPEVVSAVIMKLLAKSPEHRYRSAAGLKFDLERCLAALGTNGNIPCFQLGTQDAHSKLIFREQLYGRHRELAVLMEAFGRVRHTGRPELVLLSGDPGVGKTSIVHEVRHALVPCSLFAFGKFDQYKRNKPYATLAQAFQGLVAQLLGREEAELRRWRTALTQALQPNGQVMLNLVPELVQVIGPQPPIHELSGTEAKKRVRLVVARFLGVFARPEHPLLLFLDDLQWLDGATLDVFASLAGQQELGHVLLVGAYRDNQIRAGHLFRTCLHALRGAGIPLHEIVVGSLGIEDVTLMLADALEERAANVAPLARIVFEKAGGNPFYTTQLIATLADEGLLAYREDESRWDWDADRIGSKHISDNIVEMMIGRLRRLPAPAQGALQRLACFGNNVRTSLFERMEGLSREEAQELLHEAFASGLIAQVGDTYAFAHDRVHEAAHDLIPLAQRGVTYLRVGLRLLEVLNGDEVQADIFDIVSLINRGHELGVVPDRRTLAASLNLQAARKAKEAAAYGAACDYLAHGIAQLGAAASDAHGELAFALRLEEAECVFRGGDVERAEALLPDLLRLAATCVDKAAVYRLIVEVRLVRSDNLGAVESALCGLALLGIVLPPAPTQQDIEREYEDIWRRLDGRPLESFADLPAMTDPAALAAMRLLAEMQPPAYFSSYSMTVLVICRMVNLSLEYGVACTSTQGLALLGYVMGPVFGRYKEGYRIACLASELADKRKAALDIARVRHLTGLAAAWTEPIGVAIDWLRSAFEGGVAAGDLYYGCFEAAMLALHTFHSGRHLAVVEEECARALEFARRTGFPAGIGVVAGTERAAASLRGRTSGLADYGDDALDEANLEAGLALEEHPIVARYYWTRKLMVLYLAGAYKEALAASDKVHSGMMLRNMQIEQLDYHYYTALSLAALMDGAGGEQREAMHARVQMHHAALRAWAEEAGAPVFADKHLLVAAELARLEGRDLDAQRLYEESIQAAKAHAFVQHEAIGAEVAARYYARRGFDRIAHAYLRDARSCYARWGARGKLAQLDATHPHLREEAAATIASRTTVASVDQFDFATVIKLAQTVSGEIVLEKLLDALMRTAIEHAGARRAVLLLVQRDAWHPEAEAVMTDMGVVVRLHDAAEAIAPVPDLVIQHVMKTRETLIVDNASRQGAFATDPVILTHRVESLLAVPLINHGTLIGLLYLDNNLAANAFTPGRISVLKLIASHAAIALVNTRLFRELEQRESRIRRLVDANVIGILIWGLDGQIIDANESFLRMVQYTRADLQAGMRWFDMTPPEWQQIHIQEEAEEIRMTGTMQPREKEFFRKDGSRVPVLIGAAAFEDEPGQGVAYILDLTDLKKAQEAVRASELRYRKLQSELAHANRVATVGQLSAAISHDIRQPLVSVVTSGSAGLNWLAMEPPNIPAARRAFERIINEGHRAAEVLERTRALVKKEPPKAEAVSIPALVSETVDLVRGEAARKDVQVCRVLQAGLPPVTGDKVQLQQVLVNLIMNAIEAMSELQEPRRELVLRAFSEDAVLIWIEVIDTGPGVPAEVGARVFDPFYSTKSDGMGMGLAISRGIVEAHGGQLQVAANVPRGAVFRFCVPASGDTAGLA